MVTAASHNGAGLGGGPSTLRRDVMSRNTLHILETVKALTDAGVTLISTTDGIDSSTAAGRMAIGVLASMAEFERELIKERTALKRAISRANGTKFGRRTKVADPGPRRQRTTDESRRAHCTRCRQVPRQRGAGHIALTPRGNDRPAHPRRGYGRTHAPPAGGID
ncbi:MAG: recombinase family protein [Mycobacterium sp.]